MIGQPSAQTERGSDVRSADPTVALSLDNVHKWFGELHAVRGVTFDVLEGEVVVVIGPSGSGKTTMLRCINFLEPYHSGRVLVKGNLVGFDMHEGRLVRKSAREVAEDRRHAGMVFQGFNLFAHKTALANITEAMIHVQKIARGEAEEVARTLLERVGLGDKARAYPVELSGGQQQRVAICRALAMKPALLLFDEPTSALDPEVIGEVLDVMKELANAGMTMVVVSHEIGFAREAADRIIMMDEGSVVEAGPPAAIINEPQHPRTQRFLSKVL